MDHILYLLSAAGPTSFRFYFFLQYEYLITLPVVSKSVELSILTVRSYVVQFCTILTLPFFFLPTYSIKIWASPGDLSTAIPVNCRNALSQNITCSPDLVSARSIAAGRGLDVVTLESYYTTDCYNSLQVNAEPFRFAQLGGTLDHAQD